MGVYRRPLKVFVSSTSELGDERRAVIDAVHSLEHQPDPWEWLGSEPIDVVQRILQRVTRCDLYVGIFARRYGWKPDGEMSITELEYLRALDDGKPIFCYFLAEHLERPAANTCRGDDAKRLADLKARIDARHAVYRFTDPADLRHRVTADIAKWEREASPLAPVNLTGDYSFAGVPYFQNRSRDLQWLQEQLADDDPRFVMVCGHSGVGKSALVNRLIYDLVAEGNRGSGTDNRPFDAIVVHSVRHQQSSAVERIARLVAQLLEEPLAQQLVEKWGSQASLDEKLDVLFRRGLSWGRWLIVLDNLEAALTPDDRIAAEFSDLERFVVRSLEHHQRVRLLATSRCVPVFPPDVEAQVGPRLVRWALNEGLPEDECVALLRGLDLDGSRGLRDRPETDLLALARGCAYIPHTLVNVAEALRKEPDRTVDHLLRNPELLRRLAEQPARTLYDSLDTERRLVVQALAVYNQAVPPEAVSLALGGRDARDTLSKLDRQHVVSHERGQFWMHDLDRKYVYDQIPESDGEGARACFHSRAAGYFRTLRKPQEEWRTPTDLEPQVQELQHLMSAGEQDRACELLNDIDREHLALWNQYPRLIRWRQELARHLRARSLQGLNTGNLGCSYYEAGQVEEGMRHYREALAIAIELGDRESEGRWTGNIGLACRTLGETEQAQEHLERALGIAREIGDLRHQGRWSGNLASIRLSKGETETATGLYQEALRLARVPEVNDQRFQVIWLERLGRIAESQGDLAAARSRYRESAEVAGRIGDPNEFSLLAALARADLTIRREAEAAATYERAAEVALRWGNEIAACQAWLTAAEIYMGLGEPTKALDAYGRARAPARALQARDEEVSLLIRLGEASWLADEPQRAIGYYQEAAAIAGSSGNLTQKAIAVFDIADAFHWAGNLDEAERYYLEALQVDAPSTSVSYKSEIGLGMVHLERARKARRRFCTARWRHERRARTHLNRCAALCQQQAGDAWSNIQVLHTLGQAQLGLGRWRQALATYRRSLDIWNDKKLIRYAVRDLELLRRAGGEMRGWREALDLLTTALGGPGNGD